MGKFFRFIGWLIAVPWVSLAFVISASLAKGKSKKYLVNPESMPIEIRYRTIYKLAKKFLFIKRYKIQSQGSINLPNVPAFYVTNHKSNMDPIVLFKILYENTKIPYFRFVAKQELSNNSLLAYLLKLIDTIFIDRNNFRSTLLVFNNEINFKTDKRSIIIFPEGTRNYNPEKIIDFHIGSFRIAYNSLVPIIPVAIAGLTDKNKESKKYGYKNKNKIAYISFMKQIKPQEYANININFTVTQAHDIISNEYMRMFNLIKDNKKHPHVFEQKDEPAKGTRY